RRRVPAAVVSSGGDLERTTRSPRDASERSVRILLGSRLPTVHLGADGGWRMYGADGTTLLALPEPRERWLLEQDGRRVSARREDARAVRLGDGHRAYDMTATTQDQVYGGADVESAVGNRSVDATQGLVLLFNGAVVNAPYHANCGGFTAAPQDSWRASAEPYLQRVSDQI